MIPVPDEFLTGMYNILSNPIAVLSLILVSVYAPFHDQLIDYLRRDKKQKEDEKS